MFDPITTYRLQFHSGFTFSDFEKIIPYLHKLGVSTIYASPFFKAIHGSTHGYDVLDPLVINPEIGTLEEFRRIREQLKELDISWLQDIVPNHMAFHTENPWLSDVFEKGSRSLFASYFDIDWNHPEYKGRLMAPFFGSSLRELIKNGDLKLEYKDEKIFFMANGAGYPIKPLSYLKLQSTDAPISIYNLLDEITFIEQVTEDNTYNDKIKDWFKDLSSLLQDTYRMEWLNNRLLQINDDKSLLQELADEQFYAFCHYEETNKTINYRRFFTVNALISLNMQDEQVFQHHHQLVKNLLEEGLVQGIRVDHVDGLYNPGEYMQRLRNLAGATTYLAIEKILEPDEHLLEQWPVQGTTGYEFLALVSNLLTQEKNEQVFTKFYTELSKDHATIPRQVREKKRHILYHYMSGDLDNIYRLFLEMQLVSPEQIKELQPGILKKAIGAFLIYCPVYRYYGDTLPLASEEAGEIQQIIHLIKQKEPDLTEAISLLEEVWLQNNYENDEALKSKAIHFYLRCMQFSGPLMAKGVEDTLMYSFNRFIAHNEVGDNPDSFGFTIETFHQKMRERLQLWPLSLNASSTHDTKRGEDVRTRLNALTELPDEWFKHVEQWKALNQGLKKGNAPDANNEYFIYQTLIGTYPMPGDEDETYADRLQEYLQKAMREAKSHTDWAEPDDTYENAVKEFAVSLLEKETPFWQSFSGLHETVANYGIINSLVQTILKFTCPGVPDVYQGCELWDFSFVDPDNRRPVNFEKHETLFDSFPLNAKGAVLADRLWKKRFDGRIKLWLVNTLMNIRKQQPELFTHGSYIQLPTDGDYKDNILAFARKLGETWLIVTVPLHVTEMSQQQQLPVNKLDWKNTHIVMPEKLKGHCEDLIGDFTSKTLNKLPVQDLFQSLPFSILKIEVENNSRGAGLLMHITSLPAKFGVGDLGPEAYAFADYLFRSGQKYWQVLPVNPIEGGQGYSPYSSTSSHAGNILLISPESLVLDGLLEAGELSQYQLPYTAEANYSLAEKLKDELLTKAWEAFNAASHHSLQKAFKHFIKREDSWLHDYALYTALKKANNGKPWYEWEDIYKHRNKKKLELFSGKESNSINKIKWLQFIFDRQWHYLKGYCNDHHIQIIGDLPFYVSYDSVDVWSQREIFALDANGDKTGTAGVPPDLFSSDGQLWGMPVFKWEVLKKQDYSWWVSRLRKNKEMFDLIRLDHFRAFSSFWEVPAGETTARNGVWKAGPSGHFFRRIKKQLGTLPFLAEDLGDIDEPVYTLRDEFNFPGMKVMQFAFGDNFPFSEYLPHNFTKRFFAYTGTHDNNTTLGWLRTEANANTVSNVERYSGQKLTEANAHLVLSQLAYASVADTVIIPLQDLVGLDESARMNKPSTTSHNWSWRLLPQQLTEDAAMKLREWMHLYNRG